MQPAPDFSESLACAKEGDEQAFADLWRTYNPILLRYLALRDPESAGDLASEVWITVIRELPRYSGTERQFRTWLLELARQRVKNLNRRLAKHPRVDLDEWALEEQLDAATDAEDLVVDALSARDAVALVGRLLPPLQAEAVVLRIVVELDVDETARIMGKRAGTVRVLTHRGLRRLGSRLTEPSPKVQLEGDS